MHIGQGDKQHPNGRKIKRRQDWWAAVAVCQGQLVGPEDCLIVIDNRKAEIIMAKKPTTKIKSRPGLFGTTVHYDERGRKIGESRPGLFGDTVHYDAKGKKMGSSRSGFLGSTNHYDDNGHKVGSSDPGLFGSSKHRDEMGRQVGKSNPSFWGGMNSEFDR